MKKLCIALVSSISISIASNAIGWDSNRSAAIEFQEQGRFSGVIGKAYITANTLEIVTFAEMRGELVPFAFIYTITEKKEQADGVYRIKCQNQLGVMLVGAIDLSDGLKSEPKITLISDKGITITNMSNRGVRMKNKFLRKVRLGE